MELLINQTKPSHVPEQVWTYFAAMETSVGFRLGSSELNKQFSGYVFTQFRNLVDDPALKNWWKWLNRLFDTSDLPDLTHNTVYNVLHTAFWCEHGLSKNYKTDLIKAENALSALLRHVDTHFQVDESPHHTVTTNRLGQSIDETLSLISNRLSETDRHFGNGKKDGSIWVRRFAIPLYESWDQLGLKPTKAHLPILAYSVTPGINIKSAFDKQIERLKNIDNSRP